MEKSDWIEYKGKQIRARSIKNDYIIIAYLMENLLDVDSIKIIEEDKKYLTQTIQK